jgi:SAM-dependent methyltransferase
MTQSPIDYDGGAATFRRTRTLPDTVLDTWREAVTGLGLAPATLVADVGSGTGQFLRPLADWFGAAVVGVEPSAGMRHESRSALVAGRVAVVAGSAERLPLRSQGADVAWLSTVVHQLRGLAEAVGELHRVLRPGGHVLIRGFFGEMRMSGLHHLFPGMDRVASTFPTTTAVVDAFEAGGFRFDRATLVRERWTVDLAAWAERARSLRHVDSAFRPLTDAEFEAGLAAILALSGDAGGGRAGGGDAVGGGGGDRGAGTGVRPDAGTDEVESEMTLELVVLRRP